MENVDVKIEGNKLTLVIDLQQDLGPISSGRTTLIAKSNDKLPKPFGDVTLGLNLYRKKMG